MTPAMLQLYVARHGETALNAQWRYQGSTDCPLNEQGHAQARLLAQRLPASITHLIASPLQRALQTADAIASARGLPVDIEAAFRERDYGAFEGLNREETIERYPDLIARRIAQRWDEAPPGGETVRQAVHRIELGLLALQQRFDGQPVHLALVAHGFVARAVDWLLTGPPEAAFYTAPMMGNAEFRHYPSMRLRASAGLARA